MPIYGAYSLDNILDNNLTGQLPQIALDHSSGNKLGFDYQSLHTMDPFEEPTVLPFYYLVPGAKWTDVLSGEWLRKQAGFFVSPKLKKLLEGFSIGRHAYYSVPISLVHPEDLSEDPEEQARQKEEVEEYHFLHLAPELAKSTDYQRSTFINRLEPDQMLEINSEEDFAREKEAQNFPRWKKAFQTRKLDIFRVHGQVDVFASPELVEAIQEAEITGFKVKPARKGFEVEFE